ncbi:MAG: hypothetical protein ACI4IE_00795 [Eubacterium sp.]
MYGLLITMAARTGSTDYAQLAQALKIVSIVTFCLAGAALVFGIVCFIIFKIPKVIGDLSGRNARKSIEQMRSENEKSGKKSYRPHPIAQERGKTTEPMDIPQKPKRQKQKASPSGIPPKSQLPGEATEVLVDLDATRKMGVGAGPTEILNDPNATQPLSYDSGGTEVLSDGTQFLSDAQINEALNPNAVRFNMLQNIIIVHTDEII